MVMHPFLKNAALALLLAGALLALYAWQFGWQKPSGFVLAWDEEVLLHDATIINVRIKRDYERQGLLSRWRGVRRSTEISFDAGAPVGHVSARFQPEEVALIDRKDQTWYFALVRSAGMPPPSPEGGPPPFLRLGPDGRLVRAEAGDTLPAEFVKWNVMPDTPDPAGVARFHNTHLRLAEKMRHWSAYPRPNSDEVMRLRPQSAGPAAQR
jgi:hypothetical protein